MTNEPAADSNDNPQWKGLALFLGVAIPLGALFGFNSWFVESESLPDLVSRVIVVAGVLAGAGALFQAGAYDDRGPSFLGRMGTYLVADGAVLTAVVSLIGVFSSWYF